MEWTTASSITRAAMTAYEKRHLIQRLIVKGKARLDVGKTQIAITGHSAAGKTILAHQMHGRARDLYFQAPPLSTKTETLAITAGEWAKLVRVLPGQTAFRAKDEIRIFQENDGLEGIIHVVDFGFSHPRDQASISALVESGGIDSINKLREMNLKLEIEYLKDLFVDIRRLQKSHHSPKWLIIAVNKIDLFNDHLKSALNHYHPEGSGTFGKELNRLHQEVGKLNLDIRIVKTCAYEVDFTWCEETIKSSLPRQEQNKILIDFIEVVAALSEREP